MSGFMFFIYKNPCHVHVNADTSLGWPRLVGREVQDYSSGKTHDLVGRQETITAVRGICILGKFHEKCMDAIFSVVLKIKKIRMVSL